MDYGKHKLKVGMSLWEERAPSFSGDCITPPEERKIISETVDYQNGGTSFAVDSGWGNRALRFEDLNRDYFFTKEKADFHYELNKKLAVAEEEKRKREYAKREQKSKEVEQWVRDHSAEYVGKDVMIKDPSNRSTGEFVKTAIRTLEPNSGGVCFTVDRYVTSNWFRLSNSHVWHFPTEAEKIAERKAQEAAEAAKKAKEEAEARAKAEAQKAAALKEAAAREQARIDRIAAIKAEQAAINQQIVESNKKQISLQAELESLESQQPQPLSK